MTETVAIGQGSRVDLWCEVRGETDDTLDFWVINGEWSGTWSDGTVEVGRNGRKYPAQILWRGVVPKEITHYNAAIEWISRQLREAK